MKRAILLRLSENKNQTLGRLFVFDGLDIAFECCTLELPFKANLRNVSCIPPGEYKTTPRTSEKYKQHYLVENVMLRDYILIHPANYYTQLRGCIAVGYDFYDINADRRTRSNTQPQNYEALTSSSARRLFTYYFKLINKNKCKSFTNLFGG